MSHALVPGLRVDRIAQIRKVRELPLPGEVCVTLGQTVTQDQIVARALLPGDLHILRIAEKLGIEPFEVMNAIRRLKLREGDSVSKAQIVCEHSGLFGLLKTRFTSPVSGIIELISEKVGHLVIREPAKALSLDAYIGGVVVEVDAGKSVTIETRGAIIQGIFGVGGERKGTIRVLEVANNQAIKADDIPDQAGGSILVGGTLPDIAALRKAVAAGAIGFVTAAIDDQALSNYLGYQLGIALTGDEKIPMTLIITEGFGPLAFSQRALTLFKEFNGLPASINGATQVRAGAVRPEIIISHERATNSENEVLPAYSGGLNIGSHIRIIRVPYFGMEAEVVELPTELFAIETGAKTRILKAKLANGKVVVVPRANIEII